MKVFEFLNPNNFHEKCQYDIVQMLIKNYDNQKQ